MRQVRLGGLLSKQRGEVGMEETRPRVNFALIGAQKSGTTSLHQYLAQHPDIVMPTETELDLYGSEVSKPAPPYLYADLMEHAGGESLVGFSYVGLLFLPGAAAKLREHVPHCQIVAILRDPVARAYSAYWYHRRTGWEQAVSFEEAIEREIDGRWDGTTRENPVVRYSMMYLRNGCYAAQLDAYLKAFGRDKIFLLTTDELREAPREALSGLLQWLGVSSGLGEVDLSRRHNAAAMPRYPRLMRIVNAPPESYVKRLYRVVPERARAWLRKHVSRRLQRALVPLQYPAMRESTRKFLEDYYREANATLAERYGVDVSRWGGVS